MIQDSITQTLDTTIVGHDEVRMNRIELVGDWACVAFSSSHDAIARFAAQLFGQGNRVIILHERWPEDDRITYALMVQQNGGQS